MDLDYLQALMGEVEEEEVAYRHVWVVAETRDGVVPITLELLGAARELADMLGVYVQAALLGHGVQELAQPLIHHGADTVYLADDPALAPYRAEAYAQVLAQLVEERRPEILLLGATDLGNDLAPRLAQRLGTGLITGCTELAIDESQRLLLATYPTYQGRLMATAVCPDRRPQMATLRPGAFRPAFADEYREGTVEPVAVSIDETALRTRVGDVIAETQREEPLRRARVVVAGGRELGGPEGFALLEELAKWLGGVVGASREAVDEGWVSADRAVGGVGGVTIQPDLYLACGISGGIQHYLGVRDARFIVAINQDPRAPIFRFADVGVVGDPHQVVQALIEALNATQ
ncbi:MAG: electron transfer flavoprotein subunit alpha/FixB family protein [Anaerolineae bacterium]